MRKNWLLLGIALLVTILAIGAVACGGDDDDDEDEAPTATEEQVDADADDVAANADPDADDADDDGDAPASTATDVPAPVATEAPAPLPTDLPDDFTMGDDVLIAFDLYNANGVLSDISGFTVYVFDSDDPGVSNCTGGCLDAWPPYFANCPSCAFTAEEGIGGALSVTTDGQLTYNGRPLYFYAGDVVSGDRNGDGVGGVWHVVVVGG